MKKLIVSFLIAVAFLVSSAGFADAATRVRGYYKPSTGTYVQPHYRSSPNSSRYDNYSTRGNYNPYTGKKGSTSPYRSYYRW